MIFSSTDIRAAAEGVMRDAARALRCGPVPKQLAGAVPVPIGKAGIFCSTLPDIGAIAGLGRALLGMARADLTAMQRDLLWDRAFDLSWKEIEARNPGTPNRTLRWHYSDGLAKLSNSLRRNAK